MVLADGLGPTPLNSVLGGLSLGQHLTDWQTLEIGGEFELDVPPRSTWRWEKEPRSFVVRLPTSPLTDFRVSRHAKKQETLHRVVESFLEEILPKVVGTAPGASIEHCVNNPGAVQGVGSTSTGDWWLVRAYPVGEEYMWLQWNGPKAYLVDPVLEVFESFEPRK